MGIQKYTASNKIKLIKSNKKLSAGKKGRYYDP